MCVRQNFLRRRIAAAVLRTAACAPQLNSASVGARRQTPWSAIGVPDIRRQWCRGLRTVIDEHSRGLLPQPGFGGSTKRLEQMQDKLGEMIAAMSAEVDAIGLTEMFWISREMVDVVADSAVTLPAWTPALAAPAPHGFLCFAKPVGAVPFSYGTGHSVEVTWDGFWWWSRPDGVLQVTPLSRLPKNRDLLDPFHVTSPVWGAKTLVLNPKVPRTEEQDGASEASQLVSVVGAAWLLMGQASVSSRRTIDQAPSPGAAGGPPRPTHETLVTLVDVHRALAGDRAPSGETARRSPESRFWVTGHWRQQPCGPNWSQRKPIFVESFLKGTPGAPIVGPKERVHVLRRH